MQTLILIILIILAGSALLGCIEAALFSVPLSRVKVLAQQGKKGSVSLVKIKENMRRPITVLVIFTDAFNTIGSMMVGVGAAKSLGSAWIGIMSGILTFLLIIFGEIIPKSIGENYAETIGLFVAKPLLYMTKIFSPFIWLIEKITNPFTKEQKIVSEEEIKILSQLGHMEGSIEEDEKNLIQQVFTLNDLTAKDIMTPRTIMVALEGEKTLGEVENEIYSLSHSRVPIYHESMDNVVGVGHQREILIALGRGEKNRKISEFRREALFVPEKMRADGLLPLFQRQRCHLAVVVDEFGGTSGVVTLEDVLEQLVGEIVDEKDREVDTRVEAKRLREKILANLAVI